MITATHNHHDHDHDTAAPRSLMLFSPAGVVARSALARRAAKRLTAHGFEVSLDESALARHQRFAGDDDTRLAAIHRVARSGTDIAMALRGGYGLTRLLDRIDYKLIARSVESGTRWVGHSDFTTLQLALLAHQPGTRTYAGPLGCFDFGGETVDEVTEACFIEAMHGELEAVGFRTEEGFDGLDVRARCGAATCAWSTPCSARRTGPSSRAASCSSKT